MNMKLYISGYGKMGKMIETIILSKGLDYAGSDVQLNITTVIIIS